MAYISNCVEAAAGQKPIVDEQNNYRTPKSTKSSSWKLIDIQISLSNIHTALSNAIGDRVITRLSTTTKTQNLRDKEVHVQRMLPEHNVAVIISR